MKKTKVSKFFERIRRRLSKTRTDSTNKPIQNEEYERCVICKELTTIPISLPIEFREDYEVGLGQICGSCKTKLREEAETGNQLSDVQIMIAVENSKIEL